MQVDLKIYNTLSREKEIFEPRTAGAVGMYVCGPTVYGDAHLGHARSAITFDVVFRYLNLLGYKVRYVRNITDVGHLVADADEGEDKIGVRARLEQLEPMEVAQRYTNKYHHDLEKLNTLPPSIEPIASGHIIEQIVLIEKILAAGLAYVANGSVYFDVNKYHISHNYGRLSGRIIEDLLSSSRENLEGGQDKANPLDFALWKKADSLHLMHWPSPWGSGFPGWHIECSAMSAKYLGEQFDIHGGGMDLMFPHHECEIAQGQAAHNHTPARYWMHNNMITIDGRKMGKSLGNFITLEELFAGNHALLEQAYSPMTIRFFILQSHYRSTLDFSNQALQAARKGYIKLINGLLLCPQLIHEPTGQASAQACEETEKLCQNCYQALSDDFNTALCIAHLFVLLKKINTFYLQPQQSQNLDSASFELLTHTFVEICTKALGIKDERPIEFYSLIDNLLSDYTSAKASKQYERIDQLRAVFKQAGIAIKDSKTALGWAYEEN